MQLLLLKNSGALWHYTVFFGAKQGVENKIKKRKRACNHLINNQVQERGGDSLESTKKTAEKDQVFQTLLFYTSCISGNNERQHFFALFLLFTKTGQRRRIRKRIKQSVWRPDDKLLFPFIFQQLKPKRIITLQLHTKSKNGRCKKKQQQRRKKTPPDRQMVFVNTHAPNCRCALKSAHFFICTKFSGTCVANTHRHRQAGGNRSAW